MKVDYVTMSFPNPGEPFAASDVRAVLGHDVDLHVHSLRPKRPDAEALVDAWDLRRVGLHYNGLRASLAGLGVLVSSPRLMIVALDLLRRVARTPRHLIRTLALLPGAAAAFDVARRREASVLHAFWGHYPSLVVAFAQQAAPEIVTSVFVGAYDLEARHPITSSVLGRADFVWTHAEANRDALMDMGASPARTRVVYRGIDVSRVPPGGDKIPGRIVTVGRLISPKRMDLVLEAFRHVLAKHPDATLIVLGDGPERTRLEQRARELQVDGAVEFAGHVSHGVVLDTLSEAEVMILLSRSDSERLPNAVKEAMACRCYCVAAETPGMRELIPSRQFGVVVADVCARNVADEVRAGLEDAALLKWVGESARERILELFDSRVTMGRYVEAWTEAVERHRRGRS